MPSLKDLRNRISSVKATQKITKAMQMVAAAKLRRASMAAEAARPYAERMEKVLASLAASLGAGSNAPALLAGTGSDKTHLLVVCSAERGLCGGFNASIARLARDRAQRAAARGQDRQDHLRRQEGQRHPAPAVRRQDHRARRPARREGPELRRRRADRRQDHRHVHRGEFDVCTLFFSRFQSVILQIPTALQLIPLQLPKAPRPRRARARPTSTSPTRRTSSRPCCRATSPCRCSAPCWRTPPPSRARA